MPRNWRNRRLLPCAREKPISSQRIGKRLISNGWKTSSRGASRVNFGGGIRFLAGTGQGNRRARQGLVILCPILKLHTGLLGEGNPNLFKRRRIIVAAPFRLRRS